MWFVVFMSFSSYLLGVVSIGEGRKVILGVFDKVVF